MERLRQRLLRRLQAKPAFKAAFAAAFVNARLGGAFGERLEGKLRVVIQETNKPFKTEVRYEAHFGK